MFKWTILLLAKKRNYYIHLLYSPHTQAAGAEYVRNYSNNWWDRSTGSFTAIEPFRLSMCLYLCLTRYKFILHPVNTLNHYILLKSNNNSIFIPTSIAWVEWDRQWAFVRMSDQRQSWPLHCGRSQNGDCRRERERDTAWSRLILSELLPFNKLQSLNTKAIYGLFSE